MNKNGIVLVSLIMLVVLLSIIAMAITFYISEGLRFNASNINNLKALYMAQAGAMSAITDYLDNGLWTPVRNNHSAGAEFYYHTGKNANFLWVDASNPQLLVRRLRRIPIKNINAAGPITITNITVSWTFGGNIRRVTLGNTIVWSGTASSPANININDFSIGSGTSYSGAGDQVFQFSINIPNSSTTDIVVTFIFSDGSAFKTYLLKGGGGANKEFSVTATGEIRGAGDVEAKRTLAATYDTGTDKITSWQESASHIIP